MVAHQWSHARGSNPASHPGTRGNTSGAGPAGVVAPPPQASAPSPTAELLLYAADRAQHVEQLIRPALDRGDWVLSDRFSGSTLAYQGDGRGLDATTIRDLERIATAGVTPDLTLWLDLPIAESLRRRQTQTADRIEAEGTAFLARVAEGFRSLAAERGWAAVAADRTPDQVQQSIRAQVEAKAAQGWI